MSRPFFETLRELRAGRTLEELQDALAQVVNAVSVTNKPGEVVLKLKIRPPRCRDTLFSSGSGDVRPVNPLIGALIDGSMGRPA